MQIFIKYTAKSRKWLHFDICGSFKNNRRNFLSQECQKRLSHRLPLGAYLLKPVQRITKYQLLLKVILVILAINLYFKLETCELVHEIYTTGNLTRTFVLLQEMLKYTGVSEGSEQLQLAVDTMLSVLKYVNDLMHQIAITGFNVSECIKDRVDL